MKPWRIAFMMLAAFSLASCSKEKDGDWDPMKWNADEPVQITDGVYNVSADEGTVSFSCSNYSKPWLSSAKVNGEDIHPDKDNSGLIDSENFRAEIQGNKLSVHFKANESAQERSFSITVTAGDIFYTFNFEQAADPVWQSTCEVKYAIYAISDDMLKYYDFTVEYLDIDGQQHTEVITDNKWYYEPEPLSLADAPEEFKCRIVAVPKNSLPELNDNENDGDDENDVDHSYEIGYGVDVHVAYLNPGGDVVFKEKQPQNASFSFRTDETGLRQFIEASKELEIATFSPTISKSDAIAKLKSL